MVWSVLNNGERVFRKEKWVDNELATFIRSKGIHFKWILRKHIHVLITLNKIIICYIKFQKGTQGHLKYDGRKKLVRDIVVQSFSCKINKS